MLTKFRKNTALLLSVAVVCATVALVPQTAGAAASKAPAAGTTTDPYSAPAGTTRTNACPGCLPVMNTQRDGAQTALPQ